MFDFKRKVTTEIPDGGVSLKKQELEKRTRKIFHRIHTAQGGDPKIFNRLVSLLSCDYLQVENDYFTGKVCLDAGCGSNANATLAMLRMGAKKVYAFDLDKSVLASAPEFLCEFEGKYDLSVSNVLHMKYRDNFFDFVYCAGVLHHTADAFRGMKELARVTKPGGLLYIAINGQGALINEITDFFRDKYVSDKQFKRLVDTINEEYLMGLWKWMAEAMDEQGDSMGKKIPISFVKELFNKDLLLTMRDRITAPVYHRYTEEQMAEWLSDNGFIKIRRLTRYPKIKNIRRFLCPFYYKYDHKYSRFFYGEGVIQMKATKA